MSNYNVYMIEDKKEKQACFIKVLDYANRLAPGLGFKEGFSEGFGREPVAARKASLTPARLWEALEDEKGIYLVDLDLEDSGEGPSVKGFLDRFDDESDPDYVAVSEQFAELREANARNPIVATALEKFDVAVHILLYCKQKQKPTLLVSTQPRGDFISAVRRLNLATSADDGFPSWDPDKNSVPEPTLNQWAQLILALPDPLNRVRGSTDTWFSRKFDAGWRSLKEDGLPHDMNGWTRVSVEQHRDYVKSVFPRFPDQWWGDKTKASALHECLKTVVGAHAQWMGHIGDKPLSLGGAYLLFLLALWQKSSESTNMFLVKDWTCFMTLKNTKRSPVAFLGYQEDSESAEWSVRSLYEFFLHMICLKDGRTLGLSSLKPPEKGKPYFSLKLKWPDEDFRQIAGGLRTKVGDVFKVSRQGQIALHEEDDIASENEQGRADYLALPKSKTVGAFLRFLVASQIRDRGFGAKGAIRLENDLDGGADDKGWLKVGQFEAQP